MTNLLTNVRQGLRFLWQSDRPLTATGLAMLPLLALFLVGLVLDSRAVTGAPVWLKPAKFAASIAIYTFTLAWAFSYLRDWRRVRSIVGWTTALVLVVEMLIIATQAARGTTSHFNVSSALDAVLFSIMGAGIALQTLIAVGAAAALWLARFDDAAMGWAVRFGLTIAILGASTGGLMVQPTDEQREALRSSAPVAIVGAHTVGAPDGGAGLPGTGWSLDHGDIRVAHFVGLHAFQVLPFVALLLRRRHWDVVARTRATLVASASYAALVGLLLWQALRGQSIVRPDLTTLEAVGIWGAVTVVALTLTRLRRRSVSNAVLQL